MPRSVIHPLAARLAPTVLASALLACTATACRSTATDADDPDSISPIAAGALEVRVDRTAQALTLRNTTEFEVGYMVVEKDVITVALFPPCGQQCPIVVQGASVTVNYSAIVGYTPQAREARVLWWTYRRNADGTRTAQGGVRTTMVAL